MNKASTMATEDAVGEFLHFHSQKSVKIVKYFDDLQITQSKKKVQM
jgi:hypothetical protein